MNGGMKQYGELMHYLKLKSGNVFIHTHIADFKNGHAIVFFNPIFDEKKRCQKFYSETARAFNELGYNVLRFDYFGTGDSEGELYDFHLNLIVKDIDEIIMILKKEWKIKTISVLGVRFGADLAVHYSQFNDSVKRLFLIQPLIKGKRYLFEQRTRRKIFHKINKMDQCDIEIKIGNITYEDFQGYPLSKDSLEFLENIETDKVALTNKNITIFSLNSLFTNENTRKYSEKLSLENNVQMIDSLCREFWTSLETIDTSELTKQIVQAV